MTSSDFPSSRLGALNLPSAAHVVHGGKRKKKGGGTSQEGGGSEEALSYSGKVNMEKRPFVELWIGSPGGGRCPGATPSSLWLWGGNVTGVAGVSGLMREEFR